MGVNQLPQASHGSPPESVNGFPSPGLGSPHPQMPQVPHNSLANIPAHLLGSLTTTQQQAINQHIQMARYGQANPGFPAQHMQPNMNRGDPAAMQALQQQIYASLRQQQQQQQAHQGHQTEQTEQAH
jgi:hypothetical protein